MSYYKNIPEDFNWIAYVQLNPDLTQDIDEECAKNHYEQYGYMENRKYNYICEKPWEKEKESYEWEEKESYEWEEKEEEKFISKKRNNNYIGDNSVLWEKNIYNPSVFQYNNNFYFLTRNETDINNWEISTMSYTLYNCDENLDINYGNFCEFIIDKNKFKKINRMHLTKFYFAIEDIKVFYEPINNKIIGTCNVLVKHTFPRMFRVGIVEIDVEKNQITLLHLFTKFNININIKLKIAEKNWALYKYKHEYFLIYTLFPLIIFKMDPYTYKITKFYEDNNLQLIKNYNFSDVSDEYKHLFFSPTPLVKISYNTYIIYVKTKNNECNYKYYRWTLTIQNNSVEINTNFDLKFQGNCYYLNDVKSINNQIVGCFGIHDNNYEFIELE